MVPSLAGETRPGMFVENGRAKHLIFCVTRDVGLSFKLLPNPKAIVDKIALLLPKSTASAHVIQVVACGEGKDASGRSGTE